MKVCKRLDLEAKRASLEVKKVSAMLAVGGQKMEVIAGHAEGARKTRRPQTDQGSLDIQECEFALRFGGVDQPRARLWRIHRAAPHSLEAAIESHRVENVAGTAERVTPGL